MGWLTRGLGLLLILLYAGRTEAAPKGEGKPQLAVRGGAEWGRLSAPVMTDGAYRPADGSANLSFFETAKSRELFAGRIEAGVGVPLGQGVGLFPRGGLGFGSSLAQTHTLTVAGVPIEYGSQQMVFALTLGAELQLFERVLGLGLDLGWAGTWDAGQAATPDGLELTRYQTSGPYFRVSVSARLPWSTPWGFGIYAAADTYLSQDGWVITGNNRTYGGVFFEWDRSR